jgi:hypothetical protein
LPGSDVDDRRQLEAGSLVPRDLGEPFLGFRGDRLCAAVRTQHDDAGGIASLGARRRLQHQPEAQAVPDVLADAGDEVFLGLREVGLPLIAAGTEGPPGRLAVAEGRAHLVRDTEVGVDRPVPDAA